MKRSYAIRSPLSSTASFVAGSISTTVARGVNSMSALGELVAEPLRDLVCHWHGPRHRRDDAERRAVADPALDELVVEEEGALERRRRALERLAEDREEDRPAREARQRVAQPLRAGNRVVLVAARGEAERRGDVVLRAERDDEDVGVVLASVGRDVPRRGIDRRDRLLAELDAGLRDLAVEELRRGRLRPAEEDVELREAEREPVVAVDQRDADVVREFVGEAARELEPAEAGAEDDDVLHAANHTRRRGAGRCRETAPRWATRLKVVRRPTRRSREGVVLFSESLQRAETGVLDWIDRDITGPIRDFQNPAQEWRRMFSELYGTFFLVIVAGGGGMMGEAFPDTISRTAAVVAPGLMVMGIILFMGKVSGAHLNPAVSVGFALRGDFPWRRVPGYIVVQLIGASLAALFLHEVIKVSATFGSNYVAPGYSGSQGYLMEALLTMGLLSVILGTASGARNIGIFGAIGVGAYIALAGLWGSRSRAPR